MTGQAREEEEEVTWSCTQCCPLVNDEVTDCATW